MKPSGRWLALFSVMLAGLACREARAPSEPLASAPARALGREVHWVRSSAEYRALALQSWRAATQRLPSLAAGLEAGTWAVALDADETLLDNSSYQRQLAESGRSHDTALWEAWCRRREAGAVPGAAAFLARVESLGGRIAVVTNRSVRVQEDTEANLRALDLPFDVVLSRPEDGRGDKQARWTAVEEGSAAPGLPPLRIVLWAGDNIGDFPGLSQSSRDDPGALDDFGDRFFVLPNPMYGSWEGNPRR